MPDGIDTLAMFKRITGKKPPERKVAEPKKPVIERPPVVRLPEDWRFIHEWELGVEKRKKEGRQWLAEKLKELEGIPWEERLEEIGRQARDAGIELPGDYTKYLVPSEERVPTPKTFMEKWREAGETVIAATEYPLFEVAGVGISAADINALALIGFGIYQVGNTGWNMLLDKILKRPGDLNWLGKQLTKAAINRNLDIYSRQTGTTIPKETRNAFTKAYLDTMAAYFRGSVETQAQKGTLTIPLLQSVSQAVYKQTADIFNREITNLVPRATQTGAMAMGGLPINATAWATMSIADKANLVKSVGLSDKIVSKPWGALTNAEVEMLTKVTPPVTPEVTRLAMPTGVTGLSWAAYQKANSPQLLKAVRLAGLPDAIVTKSWYNLSEMERDALERLPFDWAGKPTPKLALPTPEVGMPEAIKPIKLRGAKAIEAAENKAKQYLAQRFEEAKGEDIYVVPQMRIEAGGERLINTADILREMGAKPSLDSEKANYWRLPEAITPPVEVAPTAIPRVEPAVANLEARRVEIKGLLATPAKDLPRGVTKVALRKELGEVSGKIVPTEEKLRQTIMAVVKTKALPQSQYRQIFKDKGGARQLTDITYTNLNKILEAVRIARPVKVHGKIVLKQSTERNIQTLKDILVTEKRLTPEIYERLKGDLKLPTDRFESASKFITESEALNLIRQMNYEAESGIAEWDARVGEALANRPELKSAIDDISSRIVKAQPKVRLQRNINWRKFAIEISEVPNDVGLSGTMSVLRALRRFQEQLGGREATRIYDVAEMMVETRRLNDVELAQRTSEMKREVPELPRVIKNKESMEKIQKWLDSDLKVAKIEKPELTPDELKVAQLFRREYDQWKDTVRLERFKDAYYHYRGNPDLIKSGTERTGEVAIPDAPLADIKEAIRIYESQGETALTNYLKTKDWGVLKSGYSFSQVIHPQLRMGQRYVVRATTTSLHQRNGLDFTRDERTAWERLVAYERQMIGMNLQPYFRKMDMEFGHIVELGKLSNPSADANKISTFLQEIKGYPVESPVARILLRIGGWSFGTLAKVPWMSVRNLHQNIAFHSDKSEIGKAIFTGGFYGNPLTRNGRLDYTNALVHQFQGVMQEQLLMGYMGRTPLENLIRKTDYYHLSDKLNRFMSMAGSGAKADNALKVYLKDGDVQKFLRNSGAIELSQTEQLRILEYLALENYDYGGILDTVSGGEAAIREIAARITTLNHFNYIRYLRSTVEMGEMGRVLGSLVAFPRSVVEKYVDIFSRLRPTKGLTGDTRKRAIHSLLAVVIGSAIANAMLNAITGKKRDAYNPFLILQWQVGGLAVGATENLTELYRQLSNLTFAKEEEDKRYAMEQLAILIPSLGDSFIPFYGPTMNILESLTDSRYLDRQTMRKLRAMFDESYKPNEEFYHIERTLLEKIQHALFGTNTPDPTDLEVALKRLTGITEGLGQIDEEALEKARQRAAEVGMPFEYQPEDYIRRTSNMGSDINSAIYGLDPSEIMLENGFSPLVLEYMEYQELFKKYQVVPADKRYDYRARNPELDAYLFFWGYVTTIQSDTARQLVEQMIDRYGIPPEAIRGYDNLYGRGVIPRAITPRPTPKRPGELDTLDIFRRITGK